MKKRFIFLALMLTLALAAFPALAEITASEEGAGGTGEQAEAAETAAPEENKEDSRYPAYACCTGERVNVRVNPGERYPRRGELIRRAPVVVLGEEGDEYLCRTVFGDGYVPKQYIRIFEGMTESEFADYTAEHPNFYRRAPKDHPGYNKKLMEQYKAGKITEAELKAKWYREPGTGYTGLTHNSKGELVVFRHSWW